MGLGTWWSWLLVLALVYGPEFGYGKDGGLRRPKRQHDWWSHYQHTHVAPGWHSRDHSAELGHLRGFGEFGGRGRHSGGIPRQLQQPLSSPISVQCTEDTLLVYVRRNFYGNGILVQPSDLSLGSQACKADPRSNDTTILFQSKLQECGSTLQTTPAYLIYSSTLTYNPASNRVIVRNNPAVVPIQCVFPRHGNVSSEAIQPTWFPFSTTVSSEDKLTFSLHLMTDDWSGPRASHVFQLGNVFNIEASVDSQNHADLILFVDRCEATTPGPTNGPHYDIITANGCLVDGMQDDASSAFRSPRMQLDKVQFTIDAFRFLGVQDSEIYITCFLRTTSASQVPDPVNKACSYSKSTNSWTPLEGSSNICQCCNTGECSVLAGQPRRWGPIVGRPRGLGKRHVGHKEERGRAILGPLLVIGAEDNHASQAGFSQASRTSPESTPVELWVLVAVASISLVVVTAGVVAIGKYLKRSRNGETVEQ